MQRRVLQELRAAPLHPGVQRITQAGAKFLDQPRLPEPRLADDQHQLPVALTRPLPAPHQHGNFLVATDQWGEMALASPASAAACPNDPVQRYRLRHPLEFMAAAFLGDEHARDLAL